MNPIRIATLIAALLFVAACDDAGVGARRALAERFLARAEGGGTTPAALPTSEALLKGEGWTLALAHAAREGAGAPGDLSKGLSWKATVDYAAHGPGGRSAELHVTAELDLRSDGAFRARVRQRWRDADGFSGEGGREALWLQHLLYTRLDDGDFFVRRSLDREHERWRAAPVAAVSELFAALAPQLEPRPAGPGRWTLAARSYAGETSENKLAALRDAENGWPDWFAALHRLEGVRGEVTLRGATLAPERVRLEATARAEVASGPLALSVEATATTSPLDAGDASWTPPKGARSPDRVRTHRRTRRILRPWLDAPQRASP